MSLIGFFDIINISYFIDYEVIFMADTNNIFSGLDDLGFENIDNLKIYKTKDELKKFELNNKTPSTSLLYDKTITCPVCGNIFKARSIKTSSYRILKKDSDFFINYSIINPYFYDVWICDSCGYASMKTDFNTIKESQKDIIKKNISTKWHCKNYPEIYDVNIAIERYKLALLNYTVMDSSSSKKAMNCLKIAWMYRILSQNEAENLFIKNALTGFKDSYINENFPIYNMDKFTIMYLIGELNRRLGNFEEALLWFGNVITSQGINQKLKSMARDQKDLIILTKKDINSSDSTINKNIEIKRPKKKGFFSKFF